MLVKNSWTKQRTGIPEDFHLPSLDPWIPFESRTNEAENRESGLSSRRYKIHKLVRRVAKERLSLITMKPVAKSR